MGLPHFSQSVFLLVGLIRVSGIFKVLDIAVISVDCYYIINILFYFIFKSLPELQAIDEI